MSMNLCFWEDFSCKVCAHGKQRGDHTVSILKTQLQQVMEQVCCENVEDFSNHLIKPN